MSADGFIAGPGGDMSWLAPLIGGEDKAVAALIPRIGALLVGRRTYGGDDPNRGREGEGEPFGGGWHGPQFVVTHARRRPRRPTSTSRTTSGGRSSGRARRRGRST